MNTDLIFISPLGTLIAYPTGITLNIFCILVEDERFETLVGCLKQAFQAWARYHAAKPPVKHFTANLSCE
jgi:hypothetical protein